MGISHFLLFHYQYWLEIRRPKIYLPKPKQCIEQQGPIVSSSKIWEYVRNISSILKLNTMLPWQILYCFTNKLGLQLCPIGFFKNYTNIGTFVFTAWKRKIQWQNVTPSGDRSRSSHDILFQVKHSTFWTNLAFAFKTETLGSLYSHALLTLSKSSKSKNQVVHEQKFKNLLSSTWVTSSERIVLDLDSEVMRGSCSIPTRGNIFHWIFMFSSSKDKNANIGIFV